MSIKPFVSMPDNIALDFILYQILPDNQPLGMPFGWLQPKEDSTITLGDIYVSCDVKLSPYDLFFYELGYTGKFESACSEYPLFEIESVMKAYKDTRKTSDKTRVKNLKRKISGILSIENPTCKFSELSRDEKILYRLAILALNTMTEAHNWSISYLESLGYAHYCLNEHGKDWQFYCPQDSDNSEILESLDPMFSDSTRLADVLGLYGYTIDNSNSGEEYHYFNEWENDNQDTQEYIKSILESLDDHPLKAYDIREYDNEIIGTLAHMVNWIKEEWQTGNLTFVLSDDMPKGLYNWYKEYSLQLTLPID